MVSSAAQLLNAILLHPQRLGDPVALTRTLVAAAGRRFSHIRLCRCGQTDPPSIDLSLCQQEEVLRTGTAITAVRRGPGVDDSIPDAPAPEEVPLSGPQPSGMNQGYEFALCGGHSTRMGWRRRQQPARLWLQGTTRRAHWTLPRWRLWPMFFPRVFVRGRPLLPIGTIGLSVLFPCQRSRPGVMTGDGYLLDKAREAAAFSQRLLRPDAGLLWNQSDRLLATTPSGLLKLVAGDKFAAKLCPN